MIDVTCKYPDIPKDHRPHMLFQEKGNCVGFLPHRTPGTPDIDMRPPTDGGEHMIDDHLECLEIPKEVCECHALVH